MSGAFGLGLYGGMEGGDEAAWVEWSRRQFHMLTRGGVWGVPRSGLVFTRTGDKHLALTEVMPHDPEMPVTPRELFQAQASDFQQIQHYMKLAGVITYDTTDTFEFD